MRTALYLLEVPSIKKQLHCRWAKPMLLFAMYLPQVIHELSFMWWWLHPLNQVRACMRLLFEDSYYSFHWASGAVTIRGAPSVQILTVHVAMTLCVYSALTNIASVCCRLSASIYYWPPRTKRRLQRNLRYSVYLIHRMVVWLIAVSILSWIFLFFGVICKFPFNVLEL